MGVCVMRRTGVCVGWECEELNGNTAEESDALGDGGRGGISGTLHVLCQSLQQQRRWRAGCEEELARQTSSQLGGSNELQGVLYAVVWRSPANFIKLVELYRLYICVALILCAAQRLQRVQHSNTLARSVGMQQVLQFPGTHRGFQSTKLAQVVYIYMTISAMPIDAASDLHAPRECKPKICQPEVARQGMGCSAL